MGKRLYYIIGVSLVILLIGIVIILNLSSKTSSTIQTTGIIEAIEIDITPMISSTIAEMPYKEGDKVDEGDVVVRLDDAKLIAQLKGAEGNLENARASFLNARAYLEVKDADIKGRDAEIEKAIAVVEEARNNFERMERLFKEGLITAMDYDKAQARYQTSNAQLKIANAQLEFAKRQYHSALAQIEASKATIKEAEANVELFKARHSDTIIGSPISGIVTKRYFEPGEMARAGIPILTIIDDSSLWARVDIDERLLNIIRIGDKTIVRPTFVPEYSYNGKVIEIGEEGEFATQRDVKRGKQDIKTFRVKVEVIENDRMLRPGMTVDVIFNIKGRR